MRFYPSIQVVNFKAVPPGHIVSVPGARDSLTLGLTVESGDDQEAPDLIVFPSNGADKSEEFHLMAGHVFEDEPALVYYDPFVKIETSERGSHLQNGVTRSEGCLYLFDNRLALCVNAPQISRTAKPLFWFDTGSRLSQVSTPNAMFTQWSILVPAENGESMTLLGRLRP